MARRGYTRRPSTGICGNCTEPVALVQCGVEEHKWAWQKKSPMARKDECNGRVYIHTEGKTAGGMDCDASETGIWREAWV